MTAVLHSTHPRQGILLNPSPSVSPYQHTSALPLLVPSNSSLSSSTSSASGLNTSDYEYFSPSAGNSKEPSPDTRAQPNRAHHDSKPRADSSPAMRRIRFAPLPDPRRDLDGEFIPVFAEDTEDTTTDVALANDSTKSRPQDSQQAQKWSGSAPLLFAGSALFSSNSNTSTAPGTNMISSSAARLLASESTPTLASTVVPHSAPPTPSASCIALPGMSPRPVVRELALARDNAPKRSSSNGSKWSRRLFKPLLGPLARSGACASTEGEAGKGGTSSRSSSRSRERGESDWVREFGTPLHRWTSENDSWALAKKKGEKGVALGRTQSLTEEERGRSRAAGANGNGAGANTSQTGSVSGRKQQRMLNGRVYGAKRNQNPFANIRAEEPEFVEWGYGGMGSVQTGGVGASVWAKVQSSGGMKVGAHEGPHARAHAGSVTTSSSDNAPASAHSRNEDTDDGSGMSWVKRRREEREKREREKEVGEAKAGPEEATKTATSAPVETPAPSPAAIAIAAAVFSPSPLATPVDAPAHAEAEHVYTAVTIPALHHHHSHSHHHSLSRAPSAQMPERKDSMDTARGIPAMSPAAVVVEEEEAARTRRESVSSESTESADEDETDGSPTPSGEGESEEKEAGDEADDEDEEEEAERRLTARGAGVEKISRHKEHVDAPLSPS